METPILETLGGHGICWICGHEFEPHAVVATAPRGPMGGGIILCPAKGCRCFTTWGVNGAACDVVPPPDEVERLRQELQAR